ncbi:MAG: glutamine synthetase family protein [Bacillota bacterium]|nr:glutamine synthetase family protein [Bacillota bacterium]
MKDIIQSLTERKVRFVHLQFTDILGMPKSVAVPVETMPKVLSEGLRFDGSSVDAFIRCQETDMYLHPDAQTFAILPWSDPTSPTARMFCNIRTVNKEPYDGCPRHRLTLIKEELAQSGLSLTVAVGLEFYLFARDESGLPNTETRDRVGYFDLAPASPGDETRRSVVLYSQDLGVPIESSHHESSPGQHGVDIASGDLLTTADRILTTKAVIKRAATMHGLHATFMPRPSDSLGPSTLHLHLQLWKNGKNILASGKQPQSLSDTATSFAAGLIRYVRDFSLITNPLVNSYKRDSLQATWGEAGNVAVMIPPERGDNTRIEFRTADPSCNPYLTLACIAAAGMQGLRVKPQPDRALFPLPLDLGQAIGAFAQSSFCREALGETLYNNLLTAKQIEWNIYGRSVNSWDVRQYLDKY